MAWPRDDRHSLLLAGMIWILIVLMVVPEGFDYQGLVAGRTPGSGSALSRLLWLGLLTLAVLVVFWRAGLAWLLTATLNPFLLIIVALAFASVSWSIDPSLSLRRLVRLGTIVIACAAFACMSWHARRFQNVVRPILTALLCGSIAFGLAFPSLAIHQEPSAELMGAWRGLANHKNGLGALSCMALIFWLHAGLTREVRLWLALAGGAIAAACLALSQSSTAMATAALASTFLIVALLAPRGLRPCIPYLVAVLVGLLLLYGLALLGLIPGLGTLMAPIAALTGKDVTLTGRTEIWGLLAEHIQSNPLLGTGYAAYWTAGPIAGTESYEFVRRLGSFYPGSAHNGYLEVLNDLGWVGLCCLAGFIAVYIRQSLRLLRIDYQQSALYLALFIQQALTNLSETHWFSVLSVDFVTMTLATTALARGLLEHRLRQAFGQPRATAPESLPTDRTLVLPRLQFAHRGRRSLTA
jgi:O-antigen ligase